DQPGLVRENLARRQNPKVLAELDEAVTADAAWRKALQETERLRAERNALAKSFAKVAKDPDGKQRVMEEGRALDSRILASEAAAEDARRSVEARLMRLPNLLHESVPFGKDDKDNQVVRTWGTPRPADPSLKSHAEIVEQWGLADFARAAKTSGAGFVFVKGALARLDFALQLFALDLLAKRGYVPIEVPLMIRRKPYEGVTDLGDFESVMYKIEADDLYLIATSEHAIGAMHMDEIIEEADLPLKYAGVSPCFRREIGAHGVDTRGLFRMHQFNKVEQFIFCTPEASWQHHEELVKNAEEVFQALKIPYRVVNVCTGDIGTVAAKKYDIEAWSPRQGKYAEVVSCSNCTDYQARRLRVRAGRVGAEKRVLHTLNSTAVATSRAMVVLLENHQRPDGTVEIPEVLRPYMGGATTLGGADAGA
ncbi:MAG: serine--tRNA ligase, partial [Methanobacteriota archaeon]